jgi:hypothetical protein
MNFSEMSNRKSEKVDVISEIISGKKKQKA